MKQKNISLWISIKYKYICMLLTYPSPWFEVLHVENNTGEEHSSDELAPVSRKYCIAIQPKHPRTTFNKWLFIELFFSQVKQYKHIHTTQWKLLFFLPSFNNVDKLFLNDAISSSMLLPKERKIYINPENARTRMW